MITHLASFVSGIWQIHAFCEGNTRTTAVFTIQYLRSVGFEINNELFANHSWYFRNALVRANYKNLVKGIDYSPVYLERFSAICFLASIGISGTATFTFILAQNGAYSRNCPREQDKLRTSSGQAQDKFRISSTRTIQTSRL